MQTRSICLINGHPDPSPERFCAAVSTAYEQAARDAGHKLARFDAGAMDVPLLASASEMEAPPPPQIAAVQEALGAADHLVLVYPLWLGGLPARLKALLEQLARGQFFIGESGPNEWPAKKMKGKSARIFVTMGMPAIVYRRIMGAHSLRALEGATLGIAGFKPVRHDLCGMVDASAKGRERFLNTARRRGAAGV